MNVGFVTAIGLLVAVVLYALGFIQGWKECKKILGLSTSAKSKKEKAKPEPPPVTCVHSCPALPSKRCSDGRCRHHCNIMCKCEENLDLMAESAIERAMDSVRREARR